MRKSFKFLISSIISFSLLSGIYAAQRGGQDLILPGSWVYDALQSIEMEMARVTFSDQAPVSINELKCYMKEIDYERLSEPGKKQYDRIQSYIDQMNWSFNWGLFSLGTEIGVNVEGYYKSNPDIDWIYDYTKRQALADLPITLGIGDYVSVYMGLQATQSFLARTSNNNYCNQIFTPDTFDAVLTHENYLSAGYMWDNGVGINLRFGSGTQSIGNSLMPSIILSEYFTDAPFINLRLFSPIFNYNMNVTQLTRESYLYTHRIEAVFFKKLQLSFIEGVLPYSSFDLRFVNPFAIFHGYALFHEYDTKVNSFFAAKFSFTPCPYLRLYGLYAQNEHTMASESAASPEGNGFQLGAETYIPVKNGIIHGGLEFYYSTPYFLIKETPNISFAKVFTEMNSGGDNFQLMGNPLGADSLAFKVALGYEVPESYSIDFAYDFAARGIFSGTKIFKESGWNKKDLSYNESNWVYPDKADKYSDGISYKSPHGTVAFENKIAVKGTWYATSWLTVVVQPGYTFIFNYDNDADKFRHGFEIALSTRINFTKMVNKKLSSDFLFTDGK